MLGLEHDLLLRDLKERRGSERDADAEEGERRLLRLLRVLPVQHLDPAANVQAEEPGGVVQQASEAHGEGPLQQVAVLRQHEVLQRQPRVLLGQEGAPHELALELLPVLGVDQLVYRLVDDVGLKEGKEGICCTV